MEKQREKNIRLEERVWHLEETVRLELKAQHEAIFTLKQFVHRKYALMIPRTSGLTITLNEILPGSMKTRLEKWFFRRDLEYLKSHPDFDPAWYLKNNLDVVGHDPARHFLLFGEPEGRQPSALYENDPDAAKEFRLNNFGRSYFVAHLRGSTRPTKRAQRAYDKSIQAFLASRKAPFVPRDASKANFTDEIVKNRFNNLKPLPVYTTKTSQGPRVVMITDSINAGSLFGGVGTAIIFSALFAKHRNASLRIVTLSEPADPANAGKILRSHGIEWSGNIDFKFVDIINEPTPIDVGSEDIFVTTSWWSTLNTMQSIDPSKILYILQEDEQMFYASGDEQLKCREVLSNPSLRFIVNSKLLHEFLIENGFENMRHRGTWFEPSFPLKSYYFAEEKRERLNFFFYARPHNLRNLYYLGLESINLAVAKGILSPAEWTFHFVGKDLQEMTLPNGVKPIILQNLQWTEYTEVMRKMDLGLSLMSTPHPSYPPLDLAACGAVAITNRYLTKQSLDQYSENIICADPTMEALVEGLERAAALARNPVLRRENYNSQKINRSWEKSFADVLTWLDKR